LISSLLVLSAMQVNSLNAQQKNEPAKATSRSSYSATTEDGETQINYSEDGHRYKIKLEGSKIIEIQVDGKKVPESDFAKYEPAVKKILEQMEKDRQQAEKDREQAEKDREQAQKDRARAEEDRKQAEKDRAQANKDREQSQKDRERSEEDRKQAEKDREQAQVSRGQAEKDRAQAELDRKQAEVDRKLAEEDRKLFKALIDDAITEKLINDEDDLKSLVLDDTEFTVNGTKQPESLHSKYKAKYLKGRHTKISYRNSGNVRGMSFN
jgi:hypothetical protein